MLFHLSVYVLAAVLLFQGVNLLGERRSPTTVIPPEVRPAPVPGSRWGVYLAACGAILALAGLLSHGFDGFAGALVPLRNLGIASEAVYGLWLVLGRKIDYTPAPASREAHGH